MLPCLAVDAGPEGTDRLRNQFLAANHEPFDAAKGQVFCQLQQLSSGDPGGEPERLRELFLGHHVEPEGEGCRGGYGNAVLDQRGKGSHTFFE